MATSKIGTSMLRNNASGFRSPSIIRVRVRGMAHFPEMIATALRNGPRMYVDLFLAKQTGTAFRQFHVGVTPHDNPDGSSATAVHFHFPTLWYPLTTHHKGSPTWAYAYGPRPEDLVEAFKAACAEWKITLTDLQERFPWLK